MEIVRQGRLSVIEFPRPRTLRVTERSSTVQAAVRDLLHSPDITRDFSAGKLRDFVKAADEVLDVVSGEEELLKLKLTAVTGGELRWGLPPLWVAVDTHPGALGRCCDPAGVLSVCLHFLPLLYSKTKFHVARRLAALENMSFMLAIVLNMVMFFWGSVHNQSSLSCSQDCVDRGVFHWVTQSWGGLVTPRGTRTEYVFGLSFPLQAAAAIRALSLLHLAVSVLMLWGYRVVHVPVFMRKLNKQRVVVVPVPALRSEFHTKTNVRAPSKTRLGAWLIAQPQLVQLRRAAKYCSHFLFSAAGVTISPMFYALELLVLADRVELFNDVVRSLQTRWGRLVTVIVLGVFAMWCFVLVGAAFYSDHVVFGTSNSDVNVFDVCRDLRSCFRCDCACTRTRACCCVTPACASPVGSVFVQYGLSEAPGFGGPDAGSPSPAPIPYFRVLYIFLYVFLFNWVVVAVITASVMANLSELQKRKRSITLGLQQKCFICDIDRASFEEVVEGGFSRHTSNEHSVWDYLAFLLRVRTQDVFAYSPAERYVADKLSAHNSQDSWCDFFPVGQAASLRSKPGPNCPHCPHCGAQ